MQHLTDMIAKMAKIPPDAISAEATLRTLGLTNSISLWRLQHALERDYKQKLPALTQELTIGELADQLEGNPAAGSSQPEGLSTAIAAPTMSPLSSSATALGIGVDLEEVHSLPKTQDYRDDAFYQGVFLPRELSYAILQANPRETLCGAFCAKEALKKTHPSLTNLRMHEILVSHEKGKPDIRVLSKAIDQQFYFQVSISHTPSYATAVVLAFLR